MMTNLLRRKTNDPMNSSVQGLAIGEADARVFDCPSCMRPLPDGTLRCPGCGTRVIMGIALKRAGAILLLGVVLGVPVGGVAMASAIGLSVAGAAPAVAVEASPAPAVTAGDLPASVVPGIPTVVIPAGAPAAAVAALSGTAVVNGRIAVDTATLNAALAKDGVTTTEMARALRSLAADAALGIDLIGRLGPWTDAAAVKSDLETFYRQMADTARQGLRASLSDSNSYRAAGDKMVAALAGLADVDAASRSLAASVELELPPVAIP